MHSGLLCIWVTDDLIIIKTRGHWWFTEGLLFLASYSYDSTSVWPQPLKLCGEVNRLSRVRNVLDVTTYKCSLFTELHAVHVVPQVNHWDRLMGHFIPQSSTQGALITGAPLTAACTYCKKKKKINQAFSSLTILEEEWEWRGSVGGKNMTEGVIVMSDSSDQLFFRPLNWYFCLRLKKRKKKHVHADPNFNENA